MRRLLLALMLAVAPTLASADSLKLHEGMPYSEARAMILKAGWQGAQPPENPGRCGGRDDICTRWPEAVDCSGTGLGWCQFHFSRGKSNLDVWTTGEEPEDIQVERWKAN